MIPIKSGREIDRMRDACQVASRVLKQISDACQPGATTKEIDTLAGELIAKEGCRSAFLGYRLGNVTFPGQICISINDEVVHGIGGDREIQFGDIVKLDCGVVHRGWVGDTAATVAVGEVAPEVADLLEATQIALANGIEKAVNGARLNDIGAAVEKYVQAKGYTVVREFVGHGVGRKLHEEPQVPNYGQAGTGPKLKPGMTLAIEPMVNLGTAGVRILPDGWTVVTLDGKPSAHYEHTVLVTDGEPEILTWREETLSKSKAKS